MSDYDFEAELAAQQHDEERLNAEAAGFGDEYDAAHPEENSAVESLDVDDYAIPPDQIARGAINTLILRYVDEQRSLPSVETLARQVLAAINAEIEKENDRRLARKIKSRAADGGHSAAKVKLGNDERLYSQRSLNPANIAQLLLHTHTIVNIAPTGRMSNPDFDMLAIYDDNPSSLTHGTYLVNESAVTVFARQFNMDLSINDVKEIMAILREQASRRERAVDRDLIAVNNGIVDYKTKKLMPFTPEHIFLSKACIDYRPDARNPICHNPIDHTDWDVESWMSELSDDPEVVELLWQIIGATIRPYVRWNKSAWFYSEQGNNGKGSLIELMRQLIGPMAYASIPLNDFSKDFALEPLTQASAILVDENDVGTFIDKAANLKAIITNDVISINRKFRTPISYQFHGFMVQCLNEFPKIKDKSESFYRRQLFVPFTKCFTGAERKYIKNDYLTRQEVLEYVLWRVINMEDYYDFAETEATTLVLDEYKEFNDPIRAFWAEYKDLFSWDLVPFPFAYDLYKKWLADAMPSSTPLGRNTFIKDLVAVSGPQAGKIADNYLSGTLTMDDLEDIWVCPSPRTRHRSCGMITTPEPLIEEVGLDEWVNPLYAIGDPNRNLPQLKEHYSGLLRASVWIKQYLGVAHVDQIEHSRQNGQAGQSKPAVNTNNHLQATNTTIDPSTPRFAPSPILARTPGTSNPAGSPGEGDSSNAATTSTNQAHGDRGRPAPETGADGNDSLNSVDDQGVDLMTNPIIPTSGITNDTELTPFTTSINDPNQSHDMTNQEHRGHGTSSAHPQHPTDAFTNPAALSAAIDELLKHPDPSANTNAPDGTQESENNS